MLKGVAQWDGAISTVLGAEVIITQVSPIWHGDFTGVVSD